MTFCKMKLMLVSSMVLLFICGCAAKIENSIAYNDSGVDAGKSLIVQRKIICNGEDLAFVKLLFERENGIYQEDPSFCLYIALSADRPSIDIVKYLVSIGANVNKPMGDNIFKSNFNVKVSYLEGVNNSLMEQFPGTPFTAFLLYNRNNASQDILKERISVLEYLFSIGGTMDWTLIPAFGLEPELLSYLISQDIDFTGRKEKYSKMLVNIEKAVNYIDQSNHDNVR